MSDAGPQSIFYRSPDDLTLHVGFYPSADPQTLRRPVICLPGLSRNGRDFHELALALSQDRVAPRDVYALDLRGRGLSEWDKDWHNYSPLVEAKDVIAFLDLRGLHDVALVGTSRGGIIAMMLAVMRPSAMGLAVLNDIGPLIETAGLARIIGYVGKIPVPRDWDEAARIVRDMNKRQFTALSDRDWERLARQIFNTDDAGRPAAGYDPALGKTLADVDISKPIPDMWAYFDAMAAMPVMVVRGENTDLLSVETVSEMGRRHPGLATVSVPNEGHAPLLDDAYTQRQIGDFIKANDRSWATGTLPDAPYKEHFEV
jgi:pimeloyl-ACP methyl ester carboxylesterase